jgi:hypothetical protein
LSESTVCEKRATPGPICGAIMIGMNASTSKLTMVPWNDGAATPTTVSG